MDSIKKKMTNLSQATSEANARTKVYEEETAATNEIAEKYEEQAGSIGV